MYHDYDKENCTHAQFYLDKYSKKVQHTINDRIAYTSFNVVASWKIICLLIPDAVMVEKICFNLKISLVYIQHIHHRKSVFFCCLFLGAVHQLYTFRNKEMFSSRISLQTSSRNAPFCLRNKPMT